ncbi:MAG: 1-(5-phosphoribosyl)-5-[(5-phosphoribosylamino) methylideneamino]imidazole-4-carboxamide isomerase [Candidatus Limnocylindrales bacterium]
MVIVPSVDVRAGRVVFRGDVGAGVDPRDLARGFVAQGADELHLVDLDGAETGVFANQELLAEIARESGIPCRLAGGITDPEQARRALDRDGFAGVLFSAAVFGDDGLLREIGTLGQRAIVELEVQDTVLAPRGGGALATRAAGRAVVDAAAAAVRAGIRELYVIDVSTDGRLGGPALGLLERIRESLGPASTGLRFHTGGGVRTLDDLRELARWGAASAVVGRAIADGRFTVAEARAATA